MAWTPSRCGLASRRPGSFSDIFVRLDAEDDKALYARWRDGDRDAGAALIERHYDSLYRFFRTKVGPDADDLVQRTVLICADHERGFRGESSFRTYVFAVARNVLLEFFRSRTKSSSRDSDVSASAVAEMSPGPSTFAAERGEFRLLVMALQQLPLDIQVTLELFYWEDLGVGELAKVLAIPPGTVKSRLYRGRELLREAMAKIDVPADDAASIRLLLADWAAQMQRRLGPAE